ncbi:FAD-dependent monooxygenase [Anthocerotibacter panamensis]|uniref:FAD-dependent monooxygenase n=1 Tax=Anthocerotibacter panamensis TaxID=2857077 RepID=UPI001C406C40|nr:FAD-dependent monooxygenase [Anthocerotibacter panamensis]
MTEPSGNGNAVLVVGAGPTGLVMAAELARRGVPCRIVDKRPARSLHSKAFGVHARTLELFDAMGIAEETIARGVQVKGVNLYAGERRIAHMHLDKLESTYPFMFFLAQHETEAVLETHLERLGGRVERSVEALGFTQDEQGVTTTLRHADEHEEAVRTCWLIGCDGAHSTVRHTLGLPFAGFPYEEEFLLADVRLHWSYPAEETHMFFAPEGLWGVLPLGKGIFRLIATAPWEAEPPRGPTLAEIQALVEARGPGNMVVSDPVWLARFRIHRRIVPTYHKGRVFLAGDAAHIHSPVGGQGMNMGIQDAYNLAWKLALVHTAAACADLLDSYDQERRPVGQGVLWATDLLTRAFALHHPLAQWLRNTLLELLFSQEFIQHQMRRALAQINVNYRHSPIVGESRGGARFSAGPAPGDRALDIALLSAKDGVTTRIYELLRGPGHLLLLLGGLRSTPTNYRNLLALGHQVQNQYGPHVAVYLVIPGKDPPTDLKEQPLVLLDPQLALHLAYGAQEGGLYLLRPDGYVGFRSRRMDGTDVSTYLSHFFSIG